MPETLPEKLQKLRKYFDTGVTRSYAFRREQLKKLRSGILQFEKQLLDALQSDLKKSAEEGFVTETGFVVAEINDALRQLKQWMLPEKAKTNLLNFPSSSYVLREPMGVVLAMAPWNYPFQLLFNPLVGAIAAGNCVVLKASEFAPATAGAMRELIKSTFPEEYVLFTDGDGAVEVPLMMNNFRFDYVFYTGSTAIGRIIYQMAASQLVPVTLELGGKSPAVVEKDANINVSARRISIAKFSNAGQMCVAPDYVLVHTSKKEALIKAMKESIRKFFTEDPSSSYNYCKIINEKQFKRLIGYLNQGNILHGGKHDIGKLYIEPTILDNIVPDGSIMKDEIFGPILPVLTFNEPKEAMEIIKRNPNPLAFYIYTSNSSKERKWIESVPFGGGCAGNSSWHLTNYNLPFGGRGSSGMGQYHGRYSFETFSHRKSIMKTPAWFDPSIKYPPWKGKLKLFKWIVR